MTQNQSKVPISCISIPSSDPDKIFQYNIAMQYALSHIPIIQTAVQNTIIAIPSFYRQMCTYPSMDIPSNPPELITDTGDPGFDFTVVNFEPNKSAGYYISRPRQVGLNLIKYNIIELRCEIVRIIDEYITRNQLPGYGITEDTIETGSIYWHIPLQER